MTRFTVQAPQEIDNIFMLFEDNYSNLISWSKYACYEPITEIIDDIEFTTYKPFEGNLLNTIKENNYLITSFETLIDEILAHLLNQFENYDAGKLGSYFSKHKKHFLNYLPEKRKLALYQNYISSLHDGYYTAMRIKYEDVVLSNEEKELAIYAYEMYCIYFLKLNKEFEELIPFYITSKENPALTKANKFLGELEKNNFFELPKVQELSESKKNNLIELLKKKPMPYGIAMFDFLGFCEYLDKEQKTKYRANKILSQLYNENAKDGTSAKHYRRSLIKPLPRYKAGEYKEIVKTDYEKLK